MKLRPGWLVLVGLCAALSCSKPQSPPSEDPDGTGGLIDEQAHGSMLEGEWSGPETAEQPLGQGPVRAPGTLFRSDLLRATGDKKPGYLMRQLAPKAFRPDGRFRGWVLGKVWPDDPQICGSGCDVMAGDIVLSVNGRILARPEQLSDLMDTVDTMSRLEVKLIRNNELVELGYDIVEG